MGIRGDVLVKLIPNYPRFVTKDWKPFDAVKLARWTEKIVFRKEDNARKYTAFYATGVYGGMATGYGVGCCFRCVFCWVELSRDFPEIYGDFYSPEEAYEKIVEAAKKYNVHKARISGCEPTLCQKHLIGVLEHIEDDPWIKIFILETNGILFGIDKDYVRRIFDKFDKVYIRVSLKAGTPEAFEKKTGAKRENFEIPFQAIKNIIETAGIETLGKRWHVAAMSLDPRIMTWEERFSLFKKLMEIDPLIVLLLEEEVVDPYDTTLLRLKVAGWELKWPLKKIYKPARELLYELLKKQS